VLLGAERKWRGDFRQYGGDVQCGQREAVKIQRNNTEPLKNSREKGNQQSSKDKAEFEEQ
jgi:hypothetical protein